MPTASYRLCDFLACPKPNEWGEHTHTDENGWTSSRYYLPDPRLLPPVLREPKPCDVSECYATTEHGNPHYHSPSGHHVSSVIHANPDSPIRLRNDDTRGSFCHPLEDAPED